MRETSNIPAHVAIIMDGNGRWAKARGKERAEGHVQGVESVRKVIKEATAKGVAYLTLYVFSTENFGRPKEEVDMLMELFCKSIINETEQLKADGARIRIIGDREAMSPKVNEHIDKIEKATAEGGAITVILALNYSARSEITRAARTLAQIAAGGGLAPGEITEEVVAAALYTSPYPDPDLIIRTGGDCRLSNFLLWQAAYSELYFTPVFWPDFDEAEFGKALESFGSRERRFGLITN
jgi:undecaprenyl diphosphate synthase